jgi:adenylate cyclase
VLLIDPHTYDEYRLTLVFERTERQGSVFDALREDIEQIASESGMEGVFKLRAADIYRVVDVHRFTPGAPPHRTSEPPAAPTTADVDEGTVVGLDVLAELARRLGRATDLDTIVALAVDGLVDLLGHAHVSLLLADEGNDRLFTIASRGYDESGVGSEVAVGVGTVGLAAARCAAIRTGNLGQLGKYTRTVRRSFEAEGHDLPGREIDTPQLDGAQSRIAVPAMAGGQLVGVVAVESSRVAAFTDADEQRLTIAATLIGSAIEAERNREAAAGSLPSGRPAAAPRSVSEPSRALQTDHQPVRSAAGDEAILVRHYDVDGSVFVAGDYLIKGVAGRVLWTILERYQAAGQVDFTNRELRLDPSLGLPAFRDNLESRLILLRRRLADRAAPMRLDKTGRGQLRLRVDGVLQLDRVR